MSRPGRATTPTIIQLRRGDPGKRAKKQYRVEPKPPSDNLTRPEWLGKTASAEWDRIVADLETMVAEGQAMLTNVDRGPLAIYCMAYGDMVDAQRMIDADGPTLDILDDAGNLKYTQQSVFVSIKSKSALLALKVGQEFGFSPSSRARIQLPDVKNDPGEFARKAGFIK